MTFEGFSVDEAGKQQYLCATTAYRQACIRAIEYLRKLVTTIIKSTYCFPVPIEGHIAGIVDVPNATLGIPMDILTLILVQKETLKRYEKLCIR